jgi:hypothetical protein
MRASIGTAGWGDDVYVALMIGDNLQYEKSWHIIRIEVSR